MRLLALVVLPAAVGYIVLAQPLVVDPARAGRRSAASSAQLTADVLVTFSLGLLSFSVYLLVLRGFYALQGHEDARSCLNLGENAVNIVAAFAFVGALGVQGLGLAYSLAYTVAPCWRWSPCGASSAASTDGARSPASPGWSSPPGSWPPPSG